jgi:5-formyltetrahydrofolate cyclo-ligase
VTALPAQFILDRVPREAHDIPVDLVIDDTLLLGGNAR